MEKVVTFVYGILHMFFDRNAQQNMEQFMPPSGRTFIRIAGASGALALMFAAYLDHVFSKKIKDKNRKHIFEVANRTHMIHSVALLGVPLVGYPVLVGVLMVVGNVLFCGTCYFQALTGNTRLGILTPIGGTLTIISWICILL